jgi:hypothetical protein
MVEMAASASASLAAGSLAAIVPGAGSWRNEAFRVPPSSVNSVDMPPDSMARHMVDSPAPGSSTALRSLKTVIATRPMRTSLGRRWGNRVNEGLTAKRLQGGRPERAGRCGAETPCHLPRQRGMTVVHPSSSIIIQRRPLLSSKWLWCELR